MRVISVETLVAVDIKGFRNAARNIDFDVYMKLSSDNIAHVFSKNTGLDYKRLAQYIQKGVQELFVHREDLEKYQNYIALTTESIFLDPNAAQEKKIAAILNMTEQNLTELFSQFHIDGDTAEKSKKLIHNYVNLLTQKPETLTVILKLVSHGEYLYYHSIAVSIFSMFISKASGQFNQRTLELVGLGGFLHDIGYTQLPKEIVEEADELNPEQSYELRTHPKLGLKMIEKTPGISNEVRYIVYQHHEEPGGKGYPNGIHGNVMYYPAKVIAVADAFSSLIVQRPSRPALTVEQAIQRMASNPNKYDKDLVALLGTIFIKAPSWKKAS